MRKYDNRGLATEMILEAWNVAKAKDFAVVCLTVGIAVTLLVVIARHGYKLEEN